MKNQYVGDINDYRKYGILRALIEGGAKLAVCWMLTPDDERSDGSRIEYLDQPFRWRRRDPQLYDALRSALQEENNRSVAGIEHAGLLPGAVFIDAKPGDTAKTRDPFFDSTLQRAQKCDVVFYDPDNGLEVASVPRGRKGAEKYLYWPEVERTWEAGHSLLIYQHYPRVSRMKYTVQRATELRDHTGCPRITCFSTQHVLFLLAHQNAHAPRLQCGIELIRRRWDGDISVLDHVAPTDTSTG